MFKFCYQGKEDAWFDWQVNLQNWACASFFNFDTLRVRVGDWVINCLVVFDTQIVLNIPIYGPGK